MSMQRPGAHVDGAFARQKRLPTFIEKELQKFELSMFHYSYDFPTIFSGVYFGCIASYGKKI
jgi:hypothetical protein